LPVIFIELEEPEEKMPQENVSVFSTEEKRCPFRRSKIISTRNSSSINLTQPPPAMDTSARDLTNKKNSPELRTIKARLLLEGIKFTNYS
jgi:hypothetical protein